LAANKLPEPAAEPNDAGVAAEPKRPPDAVQDGAPNVCDDGVPNENPPTPEPPPVADIVLGVPNWNPPDMPIPPPVADVVLGVPNWNPPDMITTSATTVCHKVHL